MIKILIILRNIAKCFFKDIILITFTFLIRASNIINNINFEVINNNLSSLLRYKNIN